MSYLINEWINDEAVYRTAPATPGLLNILFWIFLFHSICGLQMFPMAKKPKILCDLGVES